MASLSVRELEGVRDGVCGFERGDDAFETGEEAEGFERFFVGGGDVLDAPLVMEEGVLGADGGVVEPRGDGVRRSDLPALVLQDVAQRPLQDAGSAAACLIEARGM